MALPENLEEQVMGLSGHERARLARLLIASLDEGEDEDADAEAAWVAEAQRRYQQFKFGNAETIPAADVFREARDRLK